MPPRLESAPKKRVRRKAAPKSVPRDAIYQRPKPKVVRPQRTQVFGSVKRQGVNLHQAGLQQPRRVARQKERNAQAKIPNKTGPGTLEAEVRTVPRYERSSVVMPRWQLPVGVKEHQHHIGIGPLKVYTGSTYTNAQGHQIENPTKRTPSKSAEFIHREVTAPALKVLEKATVPSHAIAGVAAGHTPAYGVRHKTTFKTVLAQHGVKGALGTVGGFLGDVFTDPVTYATAGVGSVGAKAAEKAARAATKDALEGGATKKAADRAGRAAARSALDAKGGKGVQLGMRFHLPFTDLTYHPKTSGRASATVGRKIRPVTSKVRKSRAVQIAGRSFGHDFRPAERTPEQHQVIREAEREHRARKAAGGRRVVRRTQALAKALPTKEDHRAVVDALEANDLSTLTPEQAQAATSVQRRLDESHQLAYSRGIGTEKFKPQGPDDAAGYFPHYRQSDLDPKAKKSPAHGGTTRVAAAQGRTIRKPISTLRDEGAGKLFSENVPRVVGIKEARETERASLHDFWQKVAKTGRPLGRKATYDPQAEMVYRVTPHGLEALSKEGGSLVDHAKVNHALGDRENRYVILNRRTVEDVKKKLGNVPTDEELFHVYDKVQGKLKLAYTVPNPSYHARNLIGDSINAFLGDASAKSFVDAYKVLRAAGARNKLERTSVEAGHAAAMSTPLKLGKVTTTLGKELEDAEKHGVTSGGFIGRELPDQVGKQGRLSRIAQNREDLPRLATYLSARKQGMNATQAAEWSLKHHFDYGDLTSFERKAARRVIPFWTFFARNTRLQATKVVTRPGKAATIGKILNDSAQAAGFNSYDDYAGNLKDYQQRGLPLPIKFGKKVFTVQIAPPLTDLNQVTLNPQAIGQDIANRVTFFKTIAELLPPEGYSIFFQQSIQPEGDELTDAPPLVAQLPGPVKKALGVQKVEGKWQWKRKADYAVRAAPFGNVATSLAGGANPLRQQTQGQTIAGWLTGAKVTTFGSPQQRYSQVNQALHDAQIEAKRMRNRGQALDKQGFAKPEYRKQLDLVKQITAVRDEMRKKLGVPEAPKMRKVRKGGAAGGGFGGFGGGFGGGGGSGFSD